MKKIKHLIDVLFAIFDDVYKFSQIYQIDFSQEIVKRRMKNDIEKNYWIEIFLYVFNVWWKTSIFMFRFSKIATNASFRISIHAILFLIFLLLKQSLAQELEINFIIHIKIIEKQHWNHQDISISSTQLCNKIHLKQNDFNRMTKKTHNKSTFEKVVAMIMMSKNLNENQSIKRAIFIQNIENENLMSIFYWKSCYMSLRFFQIFSHDEQSWINQISLEIFQINRNLFAKRKRIEFDDFFRHNQSFVNSEVFFSKRVVIKKRTKRKNRCKWWSMW